MRMSYNTPNFTATVQAEFLRVLAVSGNVSMAARAVGMSTTTVMRHHREDEVFRSLFEEARQLCYDTLEAVVYDRALKGTPTKLWYKGEPVIDPETGVQAIEWKTDTAREALILKGRRPEVFKDRSSVEVSQAALEAQTPEQLAAGVQRYLTAARARQQVEDAVIVKDYSDVI